jgi:pseudouridylate synthase
MTHKPAGTPTGVRRRLTVAPVVGAALAAGRPVVALESTLISHGLPYPDNLEVARASEAAVRSAGAEAATVAVRDGRLLVGLDDHALRALATAAPGSVRKVARPSLAAGLAAGGWAATTVSATMIAAHAAGIEVLATGGIGGVHRGSFDGPRPSLDVSADLDELARTPVAVVCAGPKAILDVPRTLEYLETRGVPVVTIGQRGLPGFYSRESGQPSPSWVPDEAAVVAVVRTQLELGLGAGVLVCTPVPETVALAPEEVDAAIERALSEAEAAGVAGPDLTPWLLGRLAELTEGASVRTNTALIVHDAEVAGRLAAGLVAASA